MQLVSIAPSSSNTIKRLFRILTTFPEDSFCYAIQNGKTFAQGKPKFVFEWIYENNVRFDQIRVYYKHNYIADEVWIRKDGIITEPTIGIDYIKQ